MEMNSERGQGWNRYKEKTEASVVIDFDFKMQEPCQSVVFITYAMSE